MDAIAQIVKTLVAARLVGARIESVTVEPNVDSDGDAILNITIVYDGSAGDLDTSRIIGMIRHLKPRLAASHVEGFPILSFISKSDAAKLKHEAA